jgi:hypothetical protein
VAADKLPRLTRNTPSNASAAGFLDKQPIGIDRTGRAVFLFLVLALDTGRFSRIPGSPSRGPRVPPSWTLRLIFLRQFPHAYEAYQTVVREEWENPLHPRTVEELRWYFEQRTRDRVQRSRLSSDR